VCIAYQFIESKQAAAIQVRDAKHRVTCLSFAEHRAKSDHQLFMPATATGSRHYRIRSTSGLPSNPLIRE
jgi:hypothetical protein